MAGQGHALGRLQRPFAAFRAKGQGAAVRLQPDDAAGLGGGQRDLDCVVVLGRRGLGHALELAGAREPDGDGAAVAGGKAQALLVEKDLRGIVALALEGVLVLRGRVFGVRADVLVVDVGLVRAALADVAEDPHLFLVHPVARGALHGLPADANVEIHAVEGLGRDAGRFGGRGFLPLVVDGRDAIGVVRLLVPLRGAHRGERGLLGRGDCGHEGQLGPAPVVVGMACELARRIARMREIDDVCRLGITHRPQVGGGEGGLEYLGSALLVRHHAPVRQPDPHGPVAELQHAALRGAEDKGHQPAVVAQGRAQIARAGPACDTPLRHGYEIAHLPRSGAVAGLVHASAQQGRDLAAVEDVLGMEDRHQPTLRSPRNKDGHGTAGGAAWASSSTLALSSACSNICR